MNSARSRVLAGYRRLFRARKELFEGDDRALRESRVAIRSEFDKNRSAANDGPHFEGLLTMIDEAEDMLRTGFARGELNPKTGRYQVKLKPQHAVHATTTAGSTTVTTTSSTASSGPVKVTQHTPQNSQR